MRFSETFNITRTDEDDWFDPHLTIDTKLFIDPLLLFRAGGRWKAAHDELINYFAYCYELVAKGGDPSSPQAKTALRLLAFPEPDEYCLGYTAKGTKGAGSGNGFAKTIRDGIAVAIARGLDRPEHIEEVGILHEGIGADRISDMAANVLRHVFVEYTQEVAIRHGINLYPAGFRQYEFDLDYKRWPPQTVNLPRNPFNGNPIILVPETVLNDRLILDAEDWFDCDLNADIRNSLNLKVGERVSKSSIVKYAQHHPDRVRKWAQEQTSRPDLQGYNFDSDPGGMIHWDSKGREFALENPLPVREVRNADDLYELLEDILKQFKRYIEHNRGWKLLWNDNGNEKSEEAVQLLFLGLAKPYLRQFDVEIDREVELGRGPVDFKVSKGTTARVLIEVKKLHNGKFWNGLEKQLPSYLESDDAMHGWLIAVQFRDSKTIKVRKEQLPNEVDRIACSLGKNLRCTIIDARPPKSASKIIDY